MHATPLPTVLPTLLAATTRITSLVPRAFGVAPDGTPHQTSSAHGGGQKRAVRLRYELNNARALLEQLQRVVGRWEEEGGIKAGRKGMVRVRDVGAVLGAGVVVFECLEEALEELGRLYQREEEEGKEGRGVEVVRWLRHETRGEVWEMMRGLKDLGRAVWFVLTILESPSDDDVATSREDLRMAVAEILGKENDLSRWIKELYPEPEAGLSRLQETVLPSRETAKLGFSTEVRIYHLSDDATSIVAVDEDSDSDSDAGPPTPASSEFPFPDTAVVGYVATLADISSLDDIFIPIAEPTTPESVDSTPEPPSPVHPPQQDSGPLKVITVSTLGVNISPLPEDIDVSLSQHTPDTALSADTVFQLPEVTHQVVLDFFHRALQVSRFAPQFANGRTPPGCGEHDHASQRRKMQALEPRQFRELCTDLYDELVRRNVEDQNRTHRESVPRARFVEPEGFNAKRVCARRRLAELSDGQFVRFVAAVLGELGRRARGWPGAAAGEAPLKESVAKAAARLSAVQGDRWSVEAVWKEGV